MKNEETALNLNSQLLWQRSPPQAEIAHVRATFEYRSEGEMQLYAHHENLIEHVLIL